jgi:ribonuclease PH
MRTECFQPALLEPSAHKSSPELTNDGLVMSKGWCCMDEVLGSAFCEMGGSKVACYVFAPRPSTTLNTGFESGSLECDINFASHLFIEDADEVAALQKRFAQKLVDAFTPVVILDHYPKSIIYISALIMQSSRFDLCCLLNCASLALCDATVEMRDILSANCLFTPQAIKHEEKYVNIACMSKLEEMTALDVMGKYSPIELIHIIEKARNYCEKIRSVIINV